MTTAARGGGGTTARAPWGVQSERHPQVPPAERSLLLARDLGRVISGAPVLRREVRAGRLIRLRRGVYIPASEWAKRDPDARYRALVRAVALSQPSAPVLSHASAAALWGLPVLGAWPHEVDVLVDRASGGRSDPGIRRHALGVTAEAVTSIHGVPVTTFERTVVDLAATATLHSAVATVDAALHAPRYGTPRTSREDLLEVWERMLPFRGSRRAREVIDFAETGAGSVRESASRVTIALAGFPAPELQRPFIVQGTEVFVDFYWDGADCIGECDGDSKYTDPRFLGGRTSAQVVLEEKRREDALRSQVRSFVRWEARQALDTAALTRKLVAAGLRPDRASGLRRSRGS